MIGWHMQSRWHRMAEIDAAAEITHKQVRANSGFAVQADTKYRPHPKADGTLLLVSIALLLVGSY